MSRLPRRTSRVRPPLRGRAATKAYRGDFAPLASVRHPRSPYGSTGYTQRERPTPPPYQAPTVPPARPESPIPTPSETSLFADLVQFYKSWGRLLRNLDQSWQWLLALGIILSSLLLLHRLL